MPEILPWQREDAHALIERATALIRAGKLVAFPTDTIYKVAAGLTPEAIEKLHQLRGDPSTAALAITGERQALDWASDLSVLGRRLARRCWPGPVTLETGDGVERGAACRLPEAVRAVVTPGGAVRLRVPDHDCVLEVIRRLEAPILLTDAGRPATTAAQLAEQAGDAVALTIDDGPSESERDATVVRIDGAQWSVAYEGAVSAIELRPFTLCHILFVCTGNTCRSPLAQGLCIKLLSERLGCQADELPERGFIVHSAGLSAMIGREASDEAVMVAREYGADLTAHQSKPLTLEMLRYADHLFLMTQGHLQALSGLPEQVGPQPRLLSLDGADVVDPFGGELEDYRLCARQIHECLERLLSEIVT